ncbi:MAG: SPOR domain-containing protein [Rhodobacterales bacterium]
MAAQGRVDAPASGKSITTMTNWIGAVLSLALVIGVAVWGYKLLMRDVNGIPVVRAMEGPMRLQPEMPGGATADHQGLAVNQIAATGNAAPPADRLVLAPRPVALAEEDVTTADLMATAQILPMPPQPGPSTEMAAGADMTADPDAHISLRLASAGMFGLDDAPGVDVARIEPAVMMRAEPETMSAMVDQILAQILESDPRDDDAGSPAIAIPAVEGGIGQSLRPQARPASMLRQTASLGPVAMQASAPPVQDVDASTIPSGTRLVQLGAFDSPDVAKREWDRLAARFGDYLQGKSRVIQLAESGGRNFYRLRAMGFADINDSRRFCSALVAERAECIPVSAK